jgi:hypothetical protein
LIRPAAGGHLSDISNSPLSNTTVWTPIGFLRYWLYMTNGNQHTSAKYQNEPARLRRLADNADPLIRRVLLKLADEYEAEAQTRDGRASETDCRGHTR